MAPRETRAPYKRKTSNDKVKAESIARGWLKAGSDGQDLPRRKNQPSPSPVSEWQPIATAPHDDGLSRFLCYWPAYTYAAGDTPEPWIAIATHVAQGRLEVEYYHDTSEYDDYGLQRKEGWPTHWMPLPEPPK